MDRLDKSTDRLPSLSCLSLLLILFMLIMIITWSVAMVLIEN
jgi:hypothetical protein